MRARRKSRYVREHPRGRNFVPIASYWVIRAFLVVNFEFYRSMNQDLSLVERDMPSPTEIAPTARTQLSDVRKSFKISYILLWIQFPCES